MVSRRGSDRRTPRDGPADTGDGASNSSGSRGARYPLDPLVEIMDRLLGPHGCSWDKAQDHESLRPYVIEEAYEVVGAIDSGSPDKLKDELGDLLLQVVFHAALAARERTFNVNDVVDAIVSKLVRRHPHVFSGADAGTAEAVLRQWEDIKKEEAEEAAATGAGAGRPVEPRLEAHLPALMQAQKLLERAARLGRARPPADETAFGGSGADAVPSYLGGAAAAATARGSSGATAAESVFGKALLAVLESARRRGIDAELALRRACAELAQDLDKN